MIITEHVNRNHQEFEKSMISTQEWLEKVCETLGIEDKHGKGEKLSKTLLTSASIIAQQRKNQASMSNDQATMVARILKVSPMVIIASTTYENCIRLGKKEEAERWKTLYERQSSQKIIDENNHS